MSEPEAPTTDSHYPVAQVDSSVKPSIFASKIWWLAVICLIVAVALSIASLPTKGTAITIRFPAGHGLQSEDAVRYRGIDVGVVDSVELTNQLDGVNVEVTLFPSAKRLAVEGTRFWIVRPKLSITGVSGLETAVGHKYLELLPGDPNGKFARHFDGLSSAPADASGSEGIEILLQANTRHSVNAGTAIHFRGVDIGKVLSVNLAPDARHVEIRGKVDAKYRHLVTTESRFWATGGVDFDFSLRDGLKLDTESLDTLARGGVSMIVIGNGRPVAPGHVFEMAARADENWQALADQFRATTTELRGCANFQISWNEQNFFRNRRRTQAFCGVKIKSSAQQSHVILPADLLAVKNSSPDAQITLEAVGPDNRSVVLDIPNSALETFADPETSMEKSLVSLPLNLEQAKALGGDDWVDLPPKGSTVPPAAPTDAAPKNNTPVAAIVARKDPQTGTYLHLPIPAKSFTIVNNQDQPEHWSISDFTGDRAVWHGCPVLAEDDGQLIGILLIEPTTSRVVRLIPNSLGF